MCEAPGSHPSTTRAHCSGGGPSAEVRETHSLSAPGSGVSEEGPGPWQTPASILVFHPQVLDKYHPPDHFLPESYTCFFLLKLPRYSCQQVLEEKLKYAIHFCKSIDTDDYARIALTGAPTAGDSSDDSDNEDVDSFASDSTQDYLTGH